MTLSSGTVLAVFGGGIAAFGAPLAIIPGLALILCGIAIAGVGACGNPSNMEAFAHIIEQIERATSSIYSISKSETKKDGGDSGEQSP